MTCCGMMDRFKFNQLVLGNDVMNILLADEPYLIGIQARNTQIAGRVNVSGKPGLIGVTHG